ncbi:unnamed protein product [Prorocentrum cordatum]|uniref:Ribosome biogenesis regulatory protein n=1 Tax=Prorocentrum cordatum TaxID=2364126 RepID=A0ABN9WJY9_9DINO|nr:unnamed protein product [Polarella glacialis]
MARAEGPSAQGVAGSEPTLPNWSRTTSEYPYAESSDEEEASMTDERTPPAGPPGRMVELKEALEAQRDGAKRWSSDVAGSKHLISKAAARPPQGRPSVEALARHRHTQKASKKKRDAMKAWANWGGGSRKEEKGNEDHKRKKRNEWGDSKKKGVCREERGLPRSGADSPWQDAPWRKQK